MPGSPIAHKYRKGKVKRTLKRESKELEVVDRESDCDQRWELFLWWLGLSEGVLHSPLASPGPQKAWGVPKSEHVPPWQAAWESRGGVLRPPGSIRGDCGGRVVGVGLIPHSHPPTPSIPSDTLGGRPLRPSQRPRVGEPSPPLVLTHTSRHESPLKGTRITPDPSFPPMASRPSLGAKPGLGLITVARGTDEII